MEEISLCRKFYQHYYSLFTWLPFVLEASLLRFWLCLCCFLLFLYIFCIFLMFLFFIHFSLPYKVVQFHFIFILFIFFIISSLFFCHFYSLFLFVFFFLHFFSPLSSLSSSMSLFFYYIFRYFPSVSPYITLLISFPLYRILYFICQYFPSPLSFFHPFIFNRLHREQGVDATKAQGFTGCGKFRKQNINNELEDKRVIRWKVIDIAFKFCED